MVGMVKALLVTFVLALGLVPAFVAAPASAKEPCWKAVINDWYDGQIEGSYPVSCYRQALKNAPEDLRNYGDLPSDLNRALAQLLGSGGSGTGSGGASGSADARHTAGSGHNSSSGAQPTGEQVVPPPAPTDDGDESLWERAVGKVSPGSADAVPLPLIILTVLALLLLSAGAAGFVARRLQARRAVAVPAGSAGPAEPPAEP